MKSRLVMFIAAATVVGVLIVADRFQEHHAVTETGTAGTSSTPAAPTGTPASATPSPEGEPSPVVPTTLTPAPVPASPTGESQGEHTAPSTAPIVEATSRYLWLFFDKVAPDSQWRAVLASMSTKSHAATLSQVPRAAVPAARPGTLTVTRLASGAATVRATMSTGQILDVGLVLDVDGWKVSRVVPYTPVVTR